MNHDFKKGTKVIYVGNICKKLTGKTGTVINTGYSGGVVATVKVAFNIRGYRDGYTCYPSSLKIINSTWADFIKMLDKDSL